MLKFCIGNDLFQLSDMLEYFEHITNWGSGLKIPDALYMIISYSSFVCVCGFHACYLSNIPMKNLNMLSCQGNEQATRVDDYVIPKNITYGGH